MSCFISSGYTLDCRNSSVGGVSYLWILGGAGNTISGWTEDVQERITSISGSGTWYLFELSKQGTSFEETIAVNGTSQSVVYQPALTVNLPKLDYELRKLFAELTSQNNIYFIWKDNNGRYFSGAFTNGVLASAGSLSSGLAYSDLNGMSALVLGPGGEPNPTQQLLVTTNLQALMTGMTVAQEA
jgi:hypothetical protein